MTKNLPLLDMQVRNRRFESQIFSDIGKNLSYYEAIYKSSTNQRPPVKGFRVRNQQQV